MAKLWAVVVEFGKVWFTRIATEQGPKRTEHYELGLLRAAICCQQDEAESWALRNPFRKTGEVYKVIEVEVDGVKLR